MPFLGAPFQHDLFVSYSHGAFAGRHEPDLKVWSAKLAEDLRAELAGTVEFEHVSVFLDDSEHPDESVDRAEHLTGQLRQGVAGSALLTILMTPHYLRSSWCRDEREWWFEGNHPDKFGAGGRVYVCRVRTTDEKQWPKQLCDERGTPLPGYFWYDRDKPPDKARPFTWRGLTEDLNQYNNLLFDLSGDIMVRLRALKAVLEEQRRHQAEAARLAAKDGQVIYLHARKAHSEVWQRAGEALLREGFGVLPSEPEPEVRETAELHKIKDERVATLTGCDGLLLLGTEDGRALDADLVVVGRQDRHRARDQCRRLLPCAVLDTIGPQIATPWRLANARALGIDWIDATRNVCTTEVKSWLLSASAVAEHV